MRLANGPASTQVKSTTRRPSSGLPAAVGPSWRRSVGRGRGGRRPRPQSATHVVERRRAPPAAAAAPGDGVPRKRANGPGMRTSAKPSTGRNDAAELVLRVGGHLGDGLHLAEGDVPALGLEEQLAGVLGEREPLDRRSSPAASGRAPPRSVSLASSAPSGSPSSAIHSNSGAGCGTGAMLHGAGLGVGHDVGAEPVQRPLAQRPLRERQQVGEPPLEEQVLDRRGHHLVQRQVDDAARAPVSRAAYTPARPQMHAMSEPNVQVLATPRADGLVGRARDAEHAAHARRRRGRSSASRPAARCGRTA